MGEGGDRRGGGGGLGGLGAWSTARAAPSRVQPPS